MRYAASNIGCVIRILALAVLLSGTAVPSVEAAGSTGGIRITPAAIRLELDKNAAVSSANIAITNTYQTAVDLHLNIERSAQNVQGTANPASLVSLEAANITIEAGKTAAAKLTLRDAAGLSPGSQMVDLVITQRTSGANAGVGVQPAIRLPVALIKDDGAIMGIGLTSIAGRGFSMQIPQTVTVSLLNTGNMVAIPRGIVSIRDPRGVVIGQGAINTASAALAPGGKLELPVSVTPVATATVPGAYHITADFGFGGDSQSKIAGKTFIFVAPWHGALAVLCIGLAFLIVRNFKRLIRRIQAHRKKPQPLPAPPAKRRILIGRNA